MTASPTSRRTRLATAGLAVGAGVVLALAGCSAGQITQTARQVAPVNGTDVTSGDISLRNLLIEYPGPEGYPAGGDAALVVRVFNGSQSPVTLVTVSADKAASVQLVGTPEVVAPTDTPPPASPTEPTATESPGPDASPSPDASLSPEASPSPEVSPSPEPTAAPAARLSVTIPPQGYVLLVPGQGTDGFLRLTGLTEPIEPGESVEVTFTFDDGTTVTVPVPLAPPVLPVPRATPVVEPGHAEPAH